MTTRLRCICGADSEVYFRARIVPKESSGRYGTGPTKTGISRVLCKSCADSILRDLTGRLQEKTST